MDYRQAIDLAKEGKEEGFKFLYENTYKSKYYLAIQYMKDEQEAQDVLQEAYIKAFTKLDQLEKPDAFSSWLGSIVGNVAKNMLQKKNPLLFSDVATNDGEEPYELSLIHISILSRSICLRKENQSTILREPREIS